MNGKRITLVAVALTAAVAACGGQETPAVSPPAAQNTKPESAPENKRERKNNTPKSMPAPEPKKLSGLQVACEAARAFDRKFWSTGINGDADLQKLSQATDGTSLADESVKLQQLWDSNGSSSEWITTIKAMKGECR